MSNTEHWTREDYEDQDANKCRDCGHWYVCASNCGQPTPAYDPAADVFAIEMARRAEVVK